MELCDEPAVPWAGQWLQGFLSPQPCSDCSGWSWAARDAPWMSQSFCHSCIPVPSSGEGCSSPRDHCSLGVGWSCSAQEAMNRDTQHRHGRGSWNLCSLLEECQCPPVDVFHGPSWFSFLWIQPFIQVPACCKGHPVLVPAGEQLQWSSALARENSLLLSSLREILAVSTRCSANSGLSLRALLELMASQVTKESW